MRKLIWSGTFVRSVKRIRKKHPTVVPDIEKSLNLLLENPFSPQLATHKLKGKLSGVWACNAGYDLRIIFDFIKNDPGKEEDIFLISIGTHDEVY